MSEDATILPGHTGPKHYYGDIVRILFVIAAVMILAAQVVGTAFLTIPASVFAAVVLVVAAGLTNPVQVWIHWANVALSALGLLISASIFLVRFQNGNPIADVLIVMFLSVVFIVALYSSTKTLRGVVMRYAPEIK